MELRAEGPARRTRSSNYIMNSFSTVLCLPAFERELVRQALGSALTGAADGGTMCGASFARAETLPPNIRHSWYLQSVRAPGAPHLRSVTSPALPGDAAPSSA